LTLKTFLWCYRAKLGGSAAMTPTAESSFKNFAPLGTPLQGFGVQNLITSNLVQYEPTNPKNVILIRQQLFDLYCTQTNKETNTLIRLSSDCRG